MIFNCPACEKKYILSASALGADGKDVRCVACEHVWFQEPERQNYQEPDIAEVEENDSHDNFNDESVNGFLDEDEETEEDSTRSFDDDDNEALDNNKPLEDIIKEISDLNNNKDRDEESTPLETKESETPDEGIEIPKGVKPLNEEEPSKTKPKTPKTPKTKKIKIEEPMTARLMGFAGAIMIFLGFIIFAMVAKPQIVSAWPPAAAIYNLAGTPVSMKGEGLLFESLTAEFSEDKSLLNLKGSIVNLKDTPVRVPPLTASFKLVDENGADKWNIDAPAEFIEGGSSIEFSSSYDAPPKDISMVNVSFDPVFK